MKAILLTDTSVLLNILRVPGYDQNHEQVYNDFVQHIQEGAQLFLPMVTIVETGNHIAHLSDGGHRRERGKIFADTIRDTCVGKTPWVPMAFPSCESWLPWLDQVSDYAMREIGFADVSIIQDWHALCRKHPRVRVKIWSLDRHLDGYDRLP